MIDLNRQYITKQNLRQANGAYTDRYAQLFKMKKSLITIYLLIFSSLLFSQEQIITLGLSGGTSFSNIKVVNNIPGNYSYRLGVVGEFSVRMNFNPHLFISSDIGILQKGYNYDDQSPLIVDFQESQNSYLGIEKGVSHLYLNNGWTIGYQFGNKIEVLISAGAYYSYYLNSKTEDWNYIYVDPIDHEIIGDPGIPVGYHENRSSVTDRNQYVTDWDIGVTGSLGLGYRLSPKYAIRVTGKYNHGLIDTSLLYLFGSTEMYNRSFSILLGIELKL